MKTVTRLETEVENITFGFWDKANEVFITTPEEMDIEEVAKALKCSPKLVETLTMLVENIIEAVKEDLKTIWERLDELDQ